MVGWMDGQAGRYVCVPQLENTVILFTSEYQYDKTSVIISRLSDNWELLPHMVATLTLIALGILPVLGANQ